MSENYFVKYKGRLQGPLTLNQLKMGLKVGKLSRAHMVSTDRRNWSPLGDLDCIAEPARSIQPLSVEDISVKEVNTTKHETEQQHGVFSITIQNKTSNVIPSYKLVEDQYSKIMGWLLFSGIALLVSLALPMAITYGVNKNNPVLITEFLWDMWSGLSGYEKFQIIYLSVIGITLVIVSTATRGLPRAITAIVAVVSLIIIFNTKSSSAEFLNPTIIVASCGVLSASLRWLLVDPFEVRRKFVCIASSVTAGLSIFLLIFYMVSISEKVEFLNSLVNFDYTLEIIRMILIPLGLGFGIASGIIGILQIKPTSSQLNTNLALLFAGLSALLSISGVLPSLYYMMILIAVFTTVTYGAFELMLRSSEIASQKSPPPGTSGQHSN